MQSPEKVTTGCELEKGELVNAIFEGGLENFIRNLGKFWTTVRLPRGVIKYIPLRDVPFLGALFGQKIDCKRCHYFLENNKNKYIYIYIGMLFL